MDIVGLETVYNVVKMYVKTPRFLAPYNFKGMAKLLDQMIKEQIEAKEAEKAAKQAEKDKIAQEKEESLNSENNENIDTAINHTLVIDSSDITNLPILLTSASSWLSLSVPFCLLYVCHFRDDSGQQGPREDDQLACFFGKHLLHFLCKADAVEHNDVGVIAADLLRRLLQRLPVSVGRSSHADAFVHKTLPLAVVLFQLQRGRRAEPELRGVRRDRRAHSGPAARDKGGQAPDGGAGASHPRGGIRQTRQHLTVFSAFHIFLCESDRKDLCFLRKSIKM